MGRNRAAAMAKTNTTSVDRSIASQPAAVRAFLDCVRGTIRKALPDAEDGIYCAPCRKTIECCDGMSNFRPHARHVTESSTRIM